jgi:hypothetical protein
MDRFQIVSPLIAFALTNADHPLYRTPNTIFRLPSDFVRTFRPRPCGVRCSMKPVEQIGE